MCKRGEDEKGGEERIQKKGAGEEHGETEKEERERGAVTFLIHIL